MITLNIPTIRDFWKAISLFAYRRWAIPSKEIPMGVPGIRDPNNLCNAFTPIPRNFKGDYWDTCNTDGHYMCDECIHKKIKTEDEQNV